MLGWSRAELATRSKVSAATLADFEAGKRRPYSRTLADLRHALEAAGVEFITHGLRLTSVTGGAVGPAHASKPMGGSITAPSAENRASVVPTVTAAAATETPKPACVPESVVSAPADAPIATRATVQSFDWDEVVAGYAAGNVEWNRSRLGPRPGEPNCRAPAEVLKENGY
jgi:hypothetical protein